MMTNQKNKSSKRLRIGLVVPHIFMHRDILPHVIFSPGTLAIDLAGGLERAGAVVTLLSPGPIDIRTKNITADLSYFERELAGRGDTYIDLLKKHPLTFVTLARQVQGEIIARAYAMANNNELDIVHIYTNEEETALTFAGLCRKPVIFTHHDPFNFLIKYKNNFPKYKHLNWISMSLAQRRTMPAGTNWVANIYHGIPKNRFIQNLQPTSDYVAYMGRIVEPKGVHLAIAAAKEAGVPLKIAGKHYAGHKKDTYWQERVAPLLGGSITYEGFIADDVMRQQFLNNARALIVPSVYEEPFGMVIIEALACGTPVIGLNTGAIPEIITHGVTGYVIEKENAVHGIAEAINRIDTLNRRACRSDFEARFTSARMCEEHLSLYKTLTE